MEVPLLSRNDKELAAAKEVVIARVTDPNLPEESRMTQEQAKKHFDIVLAELADKVSEQNDMRQRTSFEFRAEALQEIEQRAAVSSSSADAGPVASSGAPGPAAAKIPGEGTGEDDEHMGEDDERMGEDEIDWGGAAPSASPELDQFPSPVASSSPSPAPSRSRSRSPAPSRSPSPPPGTTHVIGRAQALRRAAVVVKVVSRACVVL